MKYQPLMDSVVLAGALLVTLLGPVTAKTDHASSIELPAHWSVTPLMGPTSILGLRIYSYLIGEAEQDILRWRERHMASCRLPAVYQDDSDWHCIDAQYIYSLLWRDEGFIWVRSERLPSSTGIDAQLQPRLTDIDATVLSHSETAFESVTLLHSRRSLYALAKDLQRRHQYDGARLLFAETNVGGFIQQWQAQQTRVTYTAQKDQQGDVLLVKVRGTNL